MKEDIDSLIENLLSGFTHLLPRLTMAVLIIFIGYLIARLVKKLAHRFILFLNLRLQKRILDVDFKRPSKFMSITFFWIILVISVLTDIQVLQLGVLSGWGDKIVSYLPSVLAAVIIVFAILIFIDLPVAKVDGEFIGTVSRVSLAEIKSGKTAIDNSAVKAGNALGELFTIWPTSLIGSAESNLKP